MKALTVLALLALAGFVIYYYQRSLLALLMGLPPPRYDVTVTKDIPVTMPDGVRLMTDHYAPKAAGSFPTILIRTPYGRGGDGGPKGQGPMAQCFAERGYHVIVQGVRGRFDSEGEFDPFVNEAVDGRAALDWIAEQSWFNGALGTWGASYLGYVQWAVAADAPPFLKALAPSLISTERFTPMYPDGAFSLDTRLHWVRTLHFLDHWAGQSAWNKLSQTISLATGGVARKLETAFDHLPLIEADVAAIGEVAPLYRDLLTHPDPDHPYWKARDHTASLSQVRAPVYLLGGWYDFYLRGVLDSYATLKAAGQNPYLTIGPWAHADPGTGTAGLKEGLAWFEAHLKGDRGLLRDKPVRIHVMGAGEWRELDDWPPPARETRYFLQPEAKLLPKDPPSTAPPDRYRYDPADPTPAVGGARFDRTDAGPKDNRDLEARPDVLCYTTPPLERDVEVIGPVRLELFAQSSLAHTDFFGRLCDVDPEGRSINVCDGLFRIEPGKGEQQPEGALRIEVDMWATAYRFRRGHRLRLQVSSGAHPRWSRNLGTGEPLATGTRMEAAEQAIYHDATHPSALVLPITEG